MSKKNQAEIDKVIKANYGKKTYREIGEMLGGIKAENVRWRARQLGIIKLSPKKPELTIEEQVAQDIYESKTTQKLRNLQKKYNALLKRNDEVEFIVEGLHSPKKYSLKKIQPLKKNTGSEATAFALLSDWHVEEEVKSSKIAHPNEYNLQIARKRAEETFIGIVKLIKKEQQHYKIKNLVLALLGDFITGYIHMSVVPDLLLAPIDAQHFAEELLISGIQYILDNTDVNITCPAVVGNHSRTTEKVWIGSEQGLSLETNIYYAIRKHFERNERFEIIMPRAPEVRLSVYGLPVIFTHGHHGYTYRGGIGGPQVPIRRRIFQKYSGTDVFLVCMGHWHTYIQDIMFMINGSMVGYNYFANSKNLPFDKPKQTFFLIEKRFLSRTATTPIMYTV